MLPEKEQVLTLIIDKLKADLLVCSQAVSISRDTATHKDCLGSSKYETMGTEASYLAHGQGNRLLELNRALAYFQQLKLNNEQQQVSLSSLLRISDEHGTLQTLWLAADAGGLKVQYRDTPITVITHKSPLGRALLGKAVHDDFELTIGGKTISYEILELA